MQIVSMDGLVAQCEAKGITRSINLMLMQDVPLAPGDYITVHLGFAHEKLTEAEALDAWSIYDEMLAAMDAGPRSGLNRA